MAFNPDLYYPQYPGGPYIPVVPRVSHNNFDTTRTITDKVRALPQFQGLNEQQLQGYIQNEINYAHTNAIGLKTDYAGDGVNRAADVWDGHSA